VRSDPRTRLDTSFAKAYPHVLLSEPRIALMNIDLVLRSLDTIDSRYTLVAKLPVENVSSFTVGHYNDSQKY
jgi:hypothetical protein